MTSPFKIAVYETGENGPHLFKAMMREIINENALDIDVVGITAEEICASRLLAPEYIGLIMPGRNRGQDYRDELGELGSAMIKAAAYRTGLCTQCICAGSYVLSSKVNWYNHFMPESSKIVDNAFALFEGTALGAFDLWQDGYRSAARDADIYTSNTLAAKVMDVTFSMQEQEISGHALYWGGGVFIQNPGVYQQITPLVKHHATVCVPDASPRPHRAFHRYVEPAAVIEFSLGESKHIFSNIHPEINGYLFENLFNATPKARQNLDEFRQDKANLMASDELNKDIFRRFLSNCLANTQKNNGHNGTESVIDLKKPVAETALTR